MYFILFRFFIEYSFRNVRSPRPISLFVLIMSLPRGFSFSVTKRVYDSQTDTDIEETMTDEGDDDGVRFHRETSERRKQNTFYLN